MAIQTAVASRIRGKERKELEEKERQEREAAEAEQHEKLQIELKKRMPEDIKVRAYVDELIAVKQPAIKNQDLLLMLDDISEELQGMKEIVHGITSWENTQC